ncbi:MAG: hypothetical protein O3A21_07760 [Proteobacteria bacterium]|nr:hypothetical protein [Pseudomonadota bacterium]
MAPLAAQIYCTRGAHLSRLGDAEGAVAALGQAERDFAALGIADRSDRLARARRTGLRRIA